jgi:fluoride exporter
MTGAIVLVIAGGLGAVSRALVDALGARWQATERDRRDPTDRPPRIPWPTTAVNVTGSFAAGVIAGSVTSRPGTAALAGVLSIGFLGAFTTFSTAMLQTVDLALAGARNRAVIHGVLPLVASVGAAALGWALTG